MRVKLLPSSAIGARDAHPFESLDTNALTFDNAHADANGIARLIAA